MIDAGPSLRAAEGLSGPALARYLLRTGWIARPSRVEGISILSREIAGFTEPVEFIVPIAPGFSDEHRRMADALRSVAAVEGRTVTAIADDVRHIINAASTEMASGDRVMGFGESPSKFTNDRQQRMATGKRVCVNCGKEKELRGGKICENGHFVCYACTSGILGKKFCPLDGKKLQ